jgi:VIT1/CCC1 family predicted Fe2+/Mn2+ transporter
VALFAPIEKMPYLLYGSTILFLILLGYLSAKTGGSPIGKAILRVTIGGTLAMGISAGVGYLFGVNV